MTMRYVCDVENDHFQVLLGDSVRGPRVDTRHLWDAGTTIATLPNEREIVGLGTVRYGGRVRVVIETCPSLPIAPEGWAELGAFTLSLPSGDLLLWGPEAEDMSKAPSVSVGPGTFQCAAYSKGTDAVPDEMAPVGNDEYRIVMARTL